MITAKLERARLHIREATDLIQSYLINNPISLANKTSECGEWEIIYIEKISEVQPNIACVIGDAIFNLRAFLDHLMMQIAVSNCDLNNISIDNIYFPIKKNIEKFESWKCNDKLAKSLPKQIINEIAKLEPYPSGKNLLSSLHQLNNIDKHRALVVATVNFQSINLAGMMTKKMISEVTGLGMGGQMLSIMEGIGINDENCRKAAFVGQEITRYPVNEILNDPKIKFNFSIIESDVEVRPVVEFLGEIEKDVIATYQSLKCFYS